MKIEEMLLLSRDGKLGFSACITMDRDVLLSLAPSSYSTEDSRLAYETHFELNPVHYTLESQRKLSRRFRTLDSVARFLLGHGVRIFTVVNCFRS